MTKTLDERLLGLALKALKDANFGEVSLSEIARRIGVTKPTLYRRFDSRNGLVRSVVEHQFAQMLCDIDAQPGLPADPHEALREFASRLFDQFCQPETAQFVRFLNQEQIDNPEIAALRRSWHRKVLENLAVLIERLPQAKGRPREATVRLGALLIDLLQGPISLQWMEFSLTEALGHQTSEAFFADRYAMFLDRLDTPPAG